jgi:hypothetical protein
MEVVKHRIACIGMTAVMASCGGGGENRGVSPVSPDPSNANITITMTSAGVSPTTLSVRQGTRVLFVNNDTRDREMSSDDHPDHNECPEINTVGFIRPGQTKETANLNTIRTCGYHDHLDADNPRFRGRIVIQP